jgi:hypothetical protein
LAPFAHGFLTLESEENEEGKVITGLSRVANVIEEAEVIVGAYILG